MSPLRIAAILFLLQFSWEALEVNAHYGAEVRTQYEALAKSVR
ncbi:MAG TPA: hypothetical protein VFR18_12565 [Terriglobia bacterium]|nr:hypothetical protein [Terriglobia bacterium]